MPIPTDPTEVKSSTTATEVAKVEQKVKDGDKGGVRLHSSPEVALVQLLGGEECDEDILYRLVTSVVAREERENEAFMLEQELKRNKDNREERKLVAEIDSDKARLELQKSAHSRSNWITVLGIVGIIIGFIAAMMSSN